MDFPESFTVSCCQALRERRQKLGLSQEEVAKRSGLARSYICDVERGARHPSLKNVNILAEALQIHTSTLIEQVELGLASHIDLDALKTAHEREQAFQGEIIKYFNDFVSGGLIIADSNGFLFFNTAAKTLFGNYETENSPPEDWSDVYGCYKPDRITRFPNEELPLVRAIHNGEAADNVHLFFRNAKTPEGRYITVTARPLKGNGNISNAGVIMFKEVANAS